MPNPSAAPRRRFAAASLAAGLAVFAALAANGCGKDDPAAPQTEADLRVRFGLETLPGIPYPPNNPPRQERIALGRLMFFDPILGGEKDVSCGTCHHPAFAFADRRQFGAGATGSGLGPTRLTANSAVTGLRVHNEPRNSPTVFNVAFNLDSTGETTHMGFHFMDGRVRGLEEQARKPITSRVEMRGDAYPGNDVEAAAVALDSVIARLRNIPEYVQRFREAFPEDVAAKPGTGIIDPDNYSRALAAYQRELVTRNSPYDRYVGGDDAALTALQKQGLELFFTKGQCANCHGGAMFSDYSFVVQGVPQEGTGKATIPGDDCGREEFTKDPIHRYAFRTLTLRNIELTPPYMHAGNFETLEEVVRFYNDGAQPRHRPVIDAMLDERLKGPDGKALKLGLTEDEIKALVEFMKSLTDPGTALPSFLLTVPDRVPSGLMPLFGLKGMGSGKRAAN